MRTGTLVACVFLVGCAGAGGADPMMETTAVRAIGDTPPPAPAVADSFDRYEADADAVRPRPRPTRSISLGYIGDQPLSGGVMRDDDVPMPRATGPTWQQYIHRGSWGAPGGRTPYGYAPPNFRPYHPSPASYGYYRCVPSHYQPQ